MYSLKHICNGSLSYEANTHNDCNRKAHTGTHTYQCYTYHNRCYS